MLLVALLELGKGEPVLVATRIVNGQGVHKLEVVYCLFTSKSSPVYVSKLSKRLACMEYMESHTVMVGPVLVLFKHSRTPSRCSL